MNNVGGSVAGNLDDLASRWAAMQAELSVAVISDDEMVAAVESHHALRVELLRLAAVEGGPLAAYIMAREAYGAYSSPC